ncbi:MAG: hypothetical protein OEY09_09055 [Gammaproteobacteria bacterium]|nr:hypothetical protein [Gammaproteobacteria bacterium]
MKSFLFSLCLLPITATAANINHNNSIACISEESSLKGRHREYDANKNSEQAQSRFSAWLLAENFSDQKSKVKFIWKPKTGKGPAMEILTTDKAHNLIQVRSQTRHSLIVVSSASNPFSTESWTFAFNFQVETMIATRVQSNIAAVKGEVITYNCQFDRLITSGITTRNIFSTTQMSQLEQNQALIHDKLIQ